MMTEDELRQEMKAAARRVLEERIKQMTYNVNHSLESEIKAVAKQVVAEQHSRIRESCEQWLAKHGDALIEKSIVEMVSSSLSDLKRRLLGRDGK